MSVRIVKSREFHCTGVSCKVPANSTAPSLVLEKFASGVSSLRVLCRWRFVVSSCFGWERLLFTVLSWCVYCRVFLLKVNMLLTNFPLLQRWQDKFCVSPPNQKNFSVSYEKKLDACIKMDCLFLKNDKSMTFNKVRANTLLPQINSRWRKKSWSSNTINTWSIVGVVLSSLF